MIDCTFNTEEGKLNYRVGAIILNEGKILMVKSRTSKYYYSIGGRVHLNESSKDAVIREVYEETGVLFEIDYMGYVHENFFILNNTNETYHELSFYYYMKPIDDYSLINESLNEGGIEEKLVWIPLEDINNYKVYPEFFKDKLLLSKHELSHIITKEY